MSLGRLTPLGWTRGLLVILAGLIVSFCLFRFFNPYWRVADQDILLIFDAFLQNDGLPRQFDFHPAHLIVAICLDRIGNARVRAYSGARRSPRG